MVIEVGQISSRVSNVDNRLGSTESTIVQQAYQISQKVSATDYNGNTIASLINQTSTTIDIQASKINLFGAMNDLFDITGNLGTITSGNIDIYNDVKIGKDLYLRGTGGNAIIFGEGSRIVSYYGNLDLTTNSNLSIQGQNISFYGSSLDFSSVGSISGVARGHTWTLNSNHKSRLAWDIAVGPPQSLYDVTTLTRVGAIAKKLGIEWGGTWTNAIDRPHFEVKPTWLMPKVAS